MVDLGHVCHVAASSPAARLVGPESQSKLGLVLEDTLLFGDRWPQGLGQRA